MTFKLKSICQTRRPMFIGLLAFCGGLLSATAQECKLTRLDLEARADVQGEWVGNKDVEGANGIKGKYLNFRMDGNLTNHLSYTFRYRFNRINKDVNFFDATDYIHLTYTNKYGAVRVGKQAAAIGGWEFDRLPIDNFFVSELINNISPYLWGISAEAFLNEGKDCLQLQVTQSPYGGAVDANGRAYFRNGMYAAHLLWRGTHAWFKPIYSVNIADYDRGKQLAFLALGNRFDCDYGYLELDWVGRAPLNNPRVWEDFTVSADLAAYVHPQVKLFAKATYDVNRSEVMADPSVLPGTELTLIGGGVEYFPFKKLNHDVRVHACYAYTLGTNANASGVLTNNDSFFSIGLSWQMHVLDCLKNHR